MYLVPSSRRKTSLLNAIDVFPVVDIFYGGESVSSDQHQSYTCPHCGRLGFTDLHLLEHVGSEHADATAEVVILSICSTGAWFVHGYCWPTFVEKLIVQAFDCELEECAECTNCPLYCYTTLHPFNGLFSRQPGQAGTRNVNHSGFYWSKRWWDGNGISWTTCKSFATHSRQITMPVPHHSVLVQMHTQKPAVRNTKHDYVIIVMNLIAVNVLTCVKNPTQYVQFCVIY